MNTHTLRLPFELIPTTCAGKNLHTLLPADQWDAIRRRCYAQAGHQCEVCGRRDEPLHAHEVWNYNDRRHVQRLVGLQALCERCHFAKNETGWPTFALGFIRLPLSGRRMTHAEFVTYWCQQNGCDEATWQREAQAAYDQWLRRSQREDWHTDFGDFADLVAPWLRGRLVDLGAKRAGKMQRVPVEVIGPDGAYIEEIEEPVRRPGRWQRQPEPEDDEPVEEIGGDLPTRPPDGSAADLLRGRQGRSRRRQRP